MRLIIKKIIKKYKNMKKKRPLVVSHCFFINILRSELDRFSC